MRDDPNLLKQAAGGSATAQLTLMNIALSAGERGALRPIESLAAAETYARLAAAAGGKSETWALVHVLLARAEFETRRCAIYNTRWYEGEAKRALELLKNLGDAEADKALAEISELPDRDCHEPDMLLVAEIGQPSEGDQHVVNVRLATYLAAAAQGDLAAQGSLCDEACRLLYSGQSDPIEALTIGEIYARLGTESGNADHMRRLAGVLLKRAEYEYREGWSALADNALAEAAVMISILVDSGEGSMALWLSMLVNGSPMSAIASATCHRPTILNFIEPHPDRYDWRFMLALCAPCHVALHRQVRVTVTVTSDR